MAARSADEEGSPMRVVGATGPGAADDDGPPDSPTTRALKVARHESFSSDDNPTPTNSLVNAMLTDMYQLSMTYAYWKAGKHNDDAVFDLFFRKNPFEGEYVIFAGLDEVLRHANAFRFTDEDVAYIRTIMPHCDAPFFDYLKTLDCSRTRIYGVQAGTVVFPKEPLLRVEGPLAVGQLLETTLLNLINFPSLVATNAARMRQAVGPHRSLLEFGLRRAQGPDGAMTASKYAYVGGCDGTSNVLAGKLMGIDVKGTHAHAYVMVYTSLADITDPTLDGHDLRQLALDCRERLGFRETNEGELAAFIAYAQSFPDTFLALVDTYDTLQSGLRNYMAVALALHGLGHRALGVRLDSGDLSYLSKRCREELRAADARLGLEGVLGGSMIVASNDLNEDVLHALNKEGHEIDAFGIGTHLVTCQKQPALGCVYKLVEINSQMRIKLSNEIRKLVIPARKQVYRIFGREGHAIIDVIQASSEPAPRAGERLLCRHPFEPNKRAHVTPSRVQPLLRLVWDAAHGIVGVIPSLDDVRGHCQRELAEMRDDHKRALNATPYKVSVSAKLFDDMHALWGREAPIADLS